MNNWNEIVKVIELSIEIGLGVLAVIFLAVLWVAWKSESSEVVYPWEKAERREAKRKAKAEAKAQKEFWK